GTRHGRGFGMRKLTIGQKVLFGFSLALAFMAGVGITSYRSTMRLVENNGWVTHTHAVLGEADVLLAGLAQTESSGPGYALTADAAFFDQFETAAGRIAENQKLLREMTRDNPSQQRRLDSLGPLIDRRFAILRELMDERRKHGLPAAAAAAQQNRGKEIMNSV